MQSHFYISLHGFPEKFIYEGYIIITQSSSPDTTTSHLRKDIKDVAPTPSSNIIKSNLYYYSKKCKAVITSFFLSLGSTFSNEIFSFRTLSFTIQGECMFGWF